MDPMGLNIYLGTCLEEYMEPITLPTQSRLNSLTCNPATYTSREHFQKGWLITTTSSLLHLTKHFFLKGLIGWPLAAPASLSPTVESWWSVMGSFIQCKTYSNKQPLPTIDIGISNTSFHICIFFPKQKNTSNLKIYIVCSEMIPSGKQT